MAVPKDYDIATVAYPARRSGFTINQTKTGMIIQCFGRETRSHLDLARSREISRDRDRGVKTVRDMRDSTSAFRIKQNI